MIEAMTRRTFSTGDRRNLCSPTGNTTLLHPSEGNAVPTASLLLYPHVLVGFYVQGVVSAKLHVLILFCDTSCDLYRSRRCGSSIGCAVRRG